MRACGWCGVSGHNRRSCPSRPEHYKNSDKTRYRAKTCSYCCQEDHTRPKCKKVDADREAWIAENAAYRKRFIEDMKAHGYGIGALYSNKNSGEVIPLMVRSFDWDSVTHTNRYCYAVKVIEVSSSRAFSVCPPRYFGEGNAQERISYEMFYGIKMLSPVPFEQTLKTIPANWFDGTSGVPDRLIKKERKKRNEG